MNQQPTNVLNRIPLLLGLFLVCAQYSSMAQLTVSKNYTIEELVKKYFAGGCAEISNIKFRGYSEGIGYFNGKQSNIGIEEGVLLTSGSIFVAPGPNLVEDATFIAWQPGDADLSGLVGARTYDATVLEFDFVSFKDTVSFEYVFASEEYLEYVGSRWNDVFGFFVSGPGILGSVNIATIPGTNTPVSINTVNHLTNFQYFVDNAHGPTVEYDGFTTVLKAQIAVQACQTYHMKLAVADVSDLILDSGVFLKAGSFNAGSRVSVEAERDPPEGGCYDGGFRFIRSGNIDTSLTVHFRITGTATNGTDYVALPDSIIFPAGKDTVEVPIHANEDVEFDPDESIIISVDNYCACTPEADTLHIIQREPVRVMASHDTAVCMGSTVYLSAIGFGGSGSFSYSWSDSLGSGASVSFIPGVTHRFYVTVYDTVYKCTSIDSVQVTINEFPVADAGDDAVICPGYSTFIGKPATGGHGPYRYFWTPARGLSSQLNVTPEARPDTTTTYVVTVTSADGCVDTDTVTVSTSGLAISAGLDRQICRGQSVQIGGLATGGKGPFSYTWNPSSGLDDPFAATPVATPVGTTRYIVTATNADGCKGSDTVLVEVSNLAVNAGRDTAICFGERVTLGSYARSGAAPYNYSWSPSEGLDTTDVLHPIATPTRSIRYLLTVTDNFGCVATDSVRVTVHPMPAPAISPAGPILLCEGESVSLDASSGYRSWSWSSGESTQSIVVSRPGTFRVVVTDSNGCQGISPPVDVSVVKRPAPVISGPARLCVGSTGDYSVPVAAGSLYEWSVTGGVLRSGDGTDRITVLWNTGGTGRITIRQTLGLASCFADTTFTVVINAPSPPVINPSGYLSFCEGDSVVLSSPAGFLRYLWSNGDSTRTIVVKAGGVFSLAVEDSLGCPAASPPVRVVVFAPPNPRLTALGPTAFCMGDSVTLDAGGPYADYSWSTGAVTRTVQVRQTGVYYARVADSNGCSAVTDSMIVTVHPLPVAPIALDRYTFSTDSAASYQWLMNGVLIPGATSRRYLAVQTGSYSVAISDSNGCTAVSPALDVYMMSTEVGLPILEASPGERVVIPLQLVQSEFLDKRSSDAFDVTVRLRKNILTPTGNTPAGIFDLQDRVIHLRSTDSPLTTPLLALEFIAALGDTDSTTLHIEQFTWDDDRIVVRTTDGLFRLKVCREGGARLFESTGRAMLRQNRPNPFNAMTTIEYEVIEHGPAQILILDLLGRRVATLVDGYVEPGAYRVSFDASSLPSGQYYAVLTSGGMVKSIVMTVMK